MPRISNKPIQLLKGFKDILPEHQKYWEFFVSKAQPLLDRYGFQKIDLPILEQTSLYVKGTGRHTDIVEKELYSFQDKGGENVTLRPELTPGICRAYIEHGMLNKSQPVKLYTIGPVFRHDNPQAGRYRQFNQLDLEAIGSASPVLDAQLIIILYRLLELLGLKVQAHVNSIGCRQCRPEYIVKLKQYLSSGGRKKELCEQCKERYSKNPLRILDCKEESCQEVLAQAPQIVDSLCEECKKHFMQVLEYLDDLDIPYILNVRLVRGLDYYNRTTFEFYLADEDTTKSQGALGGGGRYDDLMEILGGRPTPGVGFAAGIERIISKLRDLKIEVPAIQKVDVFVAQLGVEARKESFKLYEKLIAEGIKVGESFSKDGLKAQLEKADSLGAKISLILGQKELIDKTIIIRDMQSGIQEIVNYDHVLDEIKKRIDPNQSSVKSYRIESQKESEEAEQDKKDEEVHDEEIHAEEQTKDESSENKDEQENGETTQKPPLQLHMPDKKTHPEDKESFIRDEDDLNNINDI
jgi:histidyl-tRNA synthetase